MINLVPKPVHEYMSAKVNPNFIHGHKKRSEMQKSRTIEKAIKQLQSVDGYLYTCDVANSIGISNSHTHKILNEMEKIGFVKSKRSASGNRWAFVRARNKCNQCGVFFNVSTSESVYLCAGCFNKRFN